LILRGGIKKIRLNKFISNSGICSRREADKFISLGLVKVNDKIITSMGYKVDINDIVKFNDSVIKAEKHKYLVLNKPKNFITTMKDPQKRNTVLDLISGACRERLFPVGRLDRNTTGVLMFTNDGDLSKKLCHPSNKISKIYRVELNKNLKSSDFEKIRKNLILEDGPVKVDKISFLETKKNIGIEIHIGKNRIVRRIFEHLGYIVTKLDRTSFAGLTKKNTVRGKYRFLTEKEVSILKRL